MHVHWQSGSPTGLSRAREGLICMLLPSIFLQYMLRTVIGYAEETSP